jgi:two-component system sensor histidine kinase BarA
MELDQLPVIDWEQAVKLAGGNRALAEEMLNLLTRSLPCDLISIKQHFEDQNYPEMLRRVHKLHGALCYCGLPRLKSVVAHLETALKSNIMDNLPSLLKQFDTEANSLLERYSCQNT